MLKVGFTGTQKGITKYQEKKLVYLLRSLNPDEFHHGMCVGGDTNFHDIITLEKCVNNLYKNSKIIGHPPINKSKYVYRKCDEYRQDKEYLVRNHDIVDEVNILIGCPESEEVLRSGTWATIRYGKKKLGKENVIIIERGEENE